MINFNDYYYFAHVVENSGITAASKALNLPKSKLSKRITMLEERLGARLIQRTSRTFLVTELGNQFYQHARNILIEARAAEVVISSRLGKHRGTVRISASPLISQLPYGRIIAAFLRDFPEVHLVQEILPRAADISGRTSDLFVVEHDTPLEDSSMIQRQLFCEPRHLAASPDYLSRMPQAACPSDLEQHHLLDHNQASGSGRWQISNHARSATTVCFQPRLVSADIVSLCAAACAGGGIAALPASISAKHVACGELVPVLPGWKVGETRLTALLPSSHGVLPEVRALLDRLSAGLSPRASGAGAKLKAA
ncbi:LysR substrate-binding domain-containing protein [Corticibacterium sp. UT-5YL-CI-8]|nr:LysR substrate-binding domain-containing protein [Tianweitania sp. UT-5YL-CI-8]